MSKILRINTAAKTVSSEEFNEAYQYMGNRGLTAKVLTEEVDPQCDPLGTGNKLVICTGIFAGTPVSTGNRTSFGAKSPLTGGIKEANVGGNFGQFLAQHDLKMIVLENSPADDGWYYVKIDQDGKVDLLLADQYVGWSTYRFVEEMNTLYGKDIAVAVVGAGGERKYKIASVMVTDFTTGHPSRAAGRGGMGAVMGSKKIKAIVIEKAKTRAKIAYPDKEKFSAAVKKYAEAAVKFPASQAINAVGTHIAIEMTAPVNVAPVHNFSGAMMKNEDLDSFNAKAFVDLAVKNGGRVGVACQSGCVVKCSNIFNDSKGRYLTGGLEYETTVLCGPNCDSYDLEYVARVDRICDELGVDCLEVGCSLGICMDEGKIPWGDKEAALALLNEMTEGTAFGNLLGEGTEILGKTLGAKRIPTVKGQALAAYDPRGIKGIGVTYATTPMGADHTAGNTVGMPIEGSQKEGQIELSKNVQLNAAFADNMGCEFGIRCGMMDPTIFPEMFEGRFGGKWDMDKVMEIARQTLKLEWEFNRAAGFTEADDQLPEFFAKEPTEKGYVWDFSGKELSGLYSL